jgi:hypothetical protein
MKQVLDGLTYTFTQQGSRKLFFFSFCMLMLGYFVLANGSGAVQVLSFSSLSLFVRIKIFLIALFDVTELMTPSILFLVVGVTLFSALVVTMFSLLFATRKQALVASGLYSGFALVLGILGVGCAACGAVILSTLLSFFGLGGLLAYFPYHGVEVGYVGLVLLFLISYSLAKRLANPLTC